MRFFRTFFCTVLISVTSLFSTTYKLTHQENNPWLGFFSIFNTALGAFDFYDKLPGKNGLIVDFEDQGYFFDPKLGSNWWNYYFEPIQIEPLNDSEIKFKAYKKVIFSFYTQLKMSRERGHELIQKYVKIKPHIQVKVDAFVREYFQNNSVIGIHYRATDKIVIEAPFVHYQTINDLMQKEIQLNNKILIFIATDDENFLHYMYQQFPGRIIATDAIRSKDGKAIHSDFTKDAYQKGEDALIDCLLLSRCSKLYKTASNLSDVAIKFNPTIPVTSLSHHYTENTRYTKYNNIKVIGTIVALLEDFEKNSTSRGFTAYFPTKDDNWWEHFFKPLQVGNPHPNLELNDADLTILGFTGIYDIAPARAHELLTKYVKLQPHLLGKIDELYSKKFNNSFVLSILYIKDTENDYQTYNTFILNTRKVLSKAPSHQKILLFSNDQTFVSLMNREFPGVVNDPLLPSWNLVEGENDLLFCLLMARSNSIIGSRSTYLKVAQQFNPKISVIEIGEYWLEK